MTPQERLKTLLDSGEYKFIKEKLTEAEIWKFTLLIKFVFDEEGQSCEADMRGDAE